MNHGVFMKKCFMLAKAACIYLQNTVNNNVVK